MWVNSCGKCLDSFLFLIEYSFVLVLFVEKTILSLQDNICSDKTLSELESGEIVSFESRLFLTRTECSECFSKWPFIPPCAGNMRGFFSNLQPENLVGFLEVKLMKL